MSHAAIDTTGASEATLKSYSIGFILSIILTAIPFGFVVYGGLSHSWTVATLFIAAAVQIIVHLYYFLHLNGSSSARWNVLALMFSVLIMALIIGGTIWIMYHLHYRLI
jgi:cytochrome o ubiquinol oxidase subunit IV